MRKMDTGVSITGQTEFDTGRTGVVGEKERIVLHTVKIAFIIARKEIM